MTCFHCRDQQAVPWCTGRRLVAKGALGVVTGAENRDLFWDTGDGKRDVDRCQKQRGPGTTTREGRGDFCLLHTTQCSKKKKRKMVKRTLVEEDRVRSEEQVKEGLRSETGGRK